MTSRKAPRRAGTVMLNRQKSLLYMIEKADRPVQHLELTKWSFLLGHEMASRGGTSFYRFVPYRLGPFSFCLYQEVSALVRDGYLADTMANEREVWRIVEDIARPTGDLAQAVRADIARVVERFKDTPADRLLNYVYQRFPWFTVNSIKQKLQARPVAAPGVFTVGYEGQQIDGLLNLLMRAGIQKVLDVRRNPVSRRYGFHGKTLNRLCGVLQIEYVHLPELGIPSVLRQNLSSLADYEALFVHYERDTLKRETAALDKAAALMLEKPSVLLCMEADPSRCHRSRLAEVISQRTGLPIRDLGTVHHEPLVHPRIMKVRVEPERRPNREAVVGAGHETGV